MLIILIIAPHPDDETLGVSVYVFLLLLEKNVIMSTALTSLHSIL